MDVSMQFAARIYVAAGQDQILSTSGLYRVTGAESARLVDFSVLTHFDPEKRLRTNGLRGTGLCLQSLPCENFSRLVSYGVDAVLEKSWNET